MAENGFGRASWKRIEVGASAQSESSITEHDDSAPSPPRGTFIGSGAIFEGNLTLTGDFRIDTDYRGNLETGGVITIGPEGSIVGDLRAREVVIYGAVVGNVTAPRQLILAAGGRLHGDLETACLEIQKHAFFRGQTSMVEPQASRRPVIGNEAAAVATGAEALPSSFARAAAPKAPQA